MIKHYGEQLIQDLDAFVPNQLGNLNFVHTLFVIVFGWFDMSKHSTKQDGKWSNYFSVMVHRHFILPDTGSTFLYFL